MLAQYPRDQSRKQNIPLRERERGGACWFYKVFAEIAIVIRLPAPALI